MRNLCTPLAAVIGMLVGCVPGAVRGEPVGNAVREFPLVVDHKATAVVVRPAGDLRVNGRGLEHMAVHDFLDYVEKSTGARLIVTENADGIAAGRPVVVLGVVGSAAKHATAKPLKRHAFLFEVTEGRMTILGADPRGLASGVHWFLRSKLGVRWYMPTELGEEVPRHASLTLKPEQTTVSPEFEWLRFTGNERELPDEIEWGVRHGDDVWDKDFRDHWQFQKNWVNLLPLTRENVTKHPDWWARDEGKPPVYHDELNVCVSNPEVIQEFVAAARRYFDADPDRVMLSLESNDSPTFCRCRECQDLLTGLGTGATQCDMYIHFCNRVIAEVRKTHPEKLFGFYAYASYGDHTYPPTRVKPNPSLRVLMTRYGHRVCNRHSLEDPRCRINPTWRENFKMWSGALGNCGVYDYWGGYQWFGPEPHTRLTKDLPLFHSRGVQYICSEAGYSWGTMGPFYYQTARLLQDTSLDGDKLIDEFCHDMYGLADAPMRRYWQRWIDAWDAGPTVETEIDSTLLPAHISKHIYRYHYDQVYPPELIAAAWKDIDEALTLVAGAPQRYRIRIQMAQFGLRYTDLILVMFRHIAAGDYLQACEPAEQAVEVMKQSRSLPGADTFETKSINAATRVAIEINHIKRVHRERQALRIAESAKALQEKRSADFEQKYEADSVDREPHPLSGYTTRPGFSGHQLTAREGVLTFRRPLGQILDSLLVNDLWPAEADDAGGWTWEFRFRIEREQKPAASHNHFVIRIGDGENSSDYPQSVFRVHSHGIFAMHSVADDWMIRDRDFTDGFHTLRLAQAPGRNETLVWMDGKFINASPAGTAVGDANQWIGGIGSTRGTILIDYIRWTGRGAFKPPIP